MRRRSAHWSRPPRKRSKLPEHLGARHREVRRLAKLLRDARTREHEQAFVVEGPRVVAAALDRDATIEAVYYGVHADRAFVALDARMERAGIRRVVLKEGVLERVGTTVTPQPVLAVARMPTPDEGALAADGLVIVALGIADPGNLGTILRTAEAANVAAIVLGEGSVDAYNPKVVRASAGAIFGVQVLEAPAVQALDALGGQGRQRLAADPRSGPPYYEVDFCRPTAVVLGSEAHGLPPEIESHLDGHVMIPMAPPAESLNVAMAAAVLSFEACRQRAAGTAKP